MIGWDSACILKMRIPCTCYASRCIHFTGQVANFWCFCACRNYEDAYSDPGSPVTRRTPQGSFVLAMVDDQKKLLMQGETHACWRSMCGLVLAWCSLKHSCCTWESASHSLHAHAA